MKVEPFLVAYAMQGVVAQRLVRKICDKCKEAYFPPTELTQALGVTTRQEFYRGRGCEECNFTGYKGRTAIFEILTISNEIRKIILQDKETNFDKILTLAQSQGMKTLRQHGVEKILNGITTPEEILLITEENN